MIIIISTVCLLIASILRAIVVFQARTNFKSGPAAEPVSMYFSWGVFEVIVNLVYIIGRADLRFYRPDRLPKKVRAIITAEQTAVVSSAESEEENDDDDDGEEEDYEEYADYEDGNQDEYASEFPDDELYFKNSTVGRESDSGLTPVNNTNFEKIIVQIRTDIIPQTLFFNLHMLENQNLILIMMNLNFRITHIYTK